MNIEKFVLEKIELSLCHLVTNPSTSGETRAAFGLLLCLIVYALFIFNIIGMMGKDLCQMLIMLC